MKHSLWHRFLGVAFIALITVNYLIWVPLIELSLVLRKRNKRELAWAGFRYFNVVFRLFRITPTVIGRENIPKGQAFIVLANHQSFIDIGNLISVICPLAFLAKKELFRLPLFGESLKFMGCIPIDRGNRIANQQLPQVLRAKIQDGFNYCVFPEGTRSTTGELLQFKSGMFKIIKEAPVPVLPVTLVETGKVMPKLGGLSLYPHRPQLVIHPVIPPEQIEQWTVQQFRDNVRVAIQSGNPR